MLLEDRLTEISVPSRTQPTARFVLSELRRRIVTGELKPGARIIERRLCEDLNVSRTPLREALKLLEIDRLVELSQHRGATVQPLLIEEAGELFDTLAVLEGHAARRVATRLTPGELDELRALHEAMCEQFKQGNRGRYFDLNTSVHQRVVSLTGNGVLIDTHRTLALRAERWRYQAILQPERWREALAEHEALMEALASADAERAGEVWHRHNIRTGAAIMRAYGEASPGRQ